LDQPEQSSRQKQLREPASKPLSTAGRIRHDAAISDSHTAASFSFFRCGDW